MRVRTNLCWGDLGPCLRHWSAERSWMVDQLLTSATQMLSVVPSRFQLVPHLVVDHAPMTSGALNGLVSYRSFASQAQVPPPADPNRNAGVQAREKVLEAIAPLRRGRPNPVSLHHATTGPSSPTKEKVELRPSELEFKDAGDESWKAARGAVCVHRSGPASPYGKHLGRARQKLIDHPTPLSRRMPKTRTQVTPAEIRPHTH